MQLTLNQKEMNLKELLMTLPPDLEAAEQLLKQNEYNAKNISIVASDFVWESVEECWEYFMEDIVRSEDVIPNLHSTYICEVLALLLQYGLDPNAIFEGNNIMDDLRYLDNGYLAADALVLLFEHGGDPNLVCDGKSVFEDVDFEVFFDAGEQQDRQRYASLVQCWMVCLAFGGTLRNGNAPVAVYRGFDLKELADHRRFYFGITKGETWPDIHIFDRRDLWEVARA